ncbi:dnaJ homolog subfamily C member 22-like [Branchiostoma lanceolatum]|uniref:dnaJ homolog subfamily C member 22-like n=1 Tax=Branchiostoma lanceolatum TaxID=7740 RepID=UPI0034559B5A
MAKSILLTYILWLIGGFFGLHHFYLRRDRQAFVWWCTCGGIFGLGWFRDLWRIPDYVRYANGYGDKFQVVENRRRNNLRPVFNVVRFGGEMALGMYFGFLAMCAIPEEVYQEGSNAQKALCYGIVTMATAIGVYIVSNIGEETVDLWDILTSASIPAIFMFAKAPDNSPTWIAVGAAVGCMYKSKYKPRSQPKSGLCRRLTSLTLAGMIIFAVWGSFLYHNASVTTSEGEKIKLRDSIDNFFTSPAWLQFKKNLWELYDYGQTHGWDKVWEQFVESLDPTGEANAIQVLGVDKDASQEEITKRYRKLAREWHPDRHKENKEQAQEKFMEIQKAYETLSTIKKKRERKSSQRRSNADDFDHRF